MTPGIFTNTDDGQFRLDRYLSRNNVKHVRLTANHLIAQAESEAGLVTSDTVVAAPDFGAVGLADDFSQQLARILDVKELDLTILKKERNLASANMSRTAGYLLEANVRGRGVNIRDDRGDSLGTALNSAQKLKDNGAETITLSLTHAIHSGEAGTRLLQAIEAGVVNQVFITNSRPLTWKKSTLV